MEINLNVLGTSMKHWILPVTTILGYQQSSHKQITISSPVSEHIRKTNTGTNEDLSL
jgi:hypothetical protein